MIFAAVDLKLDL